MEQTNENNTWVAAGIRLRAKKNFAEAIACYARALELVPNDAATWSRLGNAFKDAQLLDDAMLAHNKAVQLAPKHATICYNYGIFLQHIGDLTKAIEVLNIALQLNAKGHNEQDHNIKWELAQAHLALGNYSQGFKLYESRWHIAEKPRLQLPNSSLWHGKNFSNKTLFLHLEQGFGDTVFVMRFIPQVVSLGGTVLLECKPELWRLFKNIANISLIKHGDKLPQFDYHCPLMSLPLLLNITAENIPATIPFTIPLAAIAKAKQLVPENSAIFKIGIVWSGSVTFKGNDLRAAKLVDFLQLLKIPKVRLYSLQKGPRSKELQTLELAKLITPLGPALDDFADTAAVIANLDLVIMTDSSVAHLAATQGVPIWNIVPKNAYWMYGAVGKKSPWYPLMQLFRQRKTHDFQEVFARITVTLAKRLLPT